MIKNGGFLLLGLVLAVSLAYAGRSVTYPIVDTGQNACFDDARQTSCPEPGEEFNGQDSQYRGNQARYRDNGDGTVSDLVTGLMWVKARGNPVTFDQAVAGAARCRVGGHADWRAPTIKELYSLIDFNGYVQTAKGDSVAFINTRYFDFEWGDTARGQRIIDCQDWSATVYKGTTMDGRRTAFGVNFADGRIKGYPVVDRGGRGNRYVRYVRGNPSYGRNDFLESAPGTVEDRATGLVWQQADDGRTRNWREALSYCEDLTLGGRSDWRLPSAKELQSIVDYTRSPTSTDSAAIDPIFSSSGMEGYYWTSTTHLDGPHPGDRAAYLAFGRAMGYFAPPGSGRAKRFMDVHGAGAQRSDPKSGTPLKYPQGNGPQGDDIRIDNYVRCVTGGGVEYYEPSNDTIPAWKGGRVDSGSGRPQPGARPGSEKGRPGMRGGDRQGPPSEAFEACGGKSAGEKCTVQTPHGTMRGICRDTPEGTACVPAGGPGGGGRPPMR